MPTLTEYRKLDPTVKDVWVAALRSGDYHQGKKQLGKGDPSSHVLFCCLGVLAVVTPEQSKAYWREDNFCLRDDDQAGYFDEISMIPEWLENIYGLDEKAQTVLVGMNDDGSSFEEIANWIASHI